MEEIFVQGGLRLFLVVCPFRLPLLCPLRHRCILHLPNLCRLVVGIRKYHFFFVRFVFSFGFVFAFRIVFFLNFVLDFSYVKFACFPVFTRALFFFVFFSLRNLPFFIVEMEIQCRCSWHFSSVGRKSFIFISAKKFFSCFLYVFLCVENWSMMRR